MPTHDGRPDAVPSVTAGRPDALSPVALLAHGAASTPAFVLETFHASLAALGWRPVAPARPAGTDPLRWLTREAASARPGLVLGVSLGAHAAARWAARTGFTGTLVLVLPAWTGPPGPVAAASIAAADAVAAEGLAPVLARIDAGGHPWAATAVRSAWTAYGAAAVVRALRVAARTPGPSVAELAGLVADTTVVTLDSDPLHPRAVAEEWASRIAGARLVVVPLEEGEPDLGGAVGAALSGSRRSPGHARGDPCRPADRGRPQRSQPR